MATGEGSFRRGNGGQLVTSDGYEVLGNNAPVQIPLTATIIDVDSRGGIYADGVQTGAIDIVDFPKPYALQKQGNGLYLPDNANTAPQAAVNARVAQGYLEASNVSTISEMVQMIETNRHYGLQRIEMPAAAHQVWTNRTLFLDYYRPASPLAQRMPVILVLPIIGGGYPLERMFCGVSASSMAWICTGAGPLRATSPPSSPGW